MSEEKVTAPAEPGPPSGRNWRQLIKEHPGTTIAIAAGVAALGGAEWAVGALLGLGAGMLLTRKTGPQMRELMQKRIHDWTTFRHGEPTPPAK
jgi:hypothetical protein